MNELELRADRRAALLKVTVRPRASRRALVGVQGGALKVQLQAPPEKGKANKELLDFLAQTLTLKKKQLTLQSGTTSRDKTVRIEDTGIEELREKIHLALGSA